MIIRTFSTWFQKQGANITGPAAFGVRITIHILDYFWGAWDAYRVKLSVGRDLMLNPPQKGAPLNTFCYPYAEIGGKPLDWLDPATFKYAITYRQK